MPVAVVNIEDTERFELKTLDGAYVVLKRMSYGQMLQRRMFTKLTVESSGRSKDFRGEMAMANVKTTEFEFAHCIVDHNLQDNDERLLDLKKPGDFNKLDPKVGQEIEGYISDMNNFEDDEEDLGEGSKQA